MTEEFYTYITRQNDRWDLIAYEYYNNALLYEQIIKANPDIEITPVLKEGIQIKVPVLQEETTIQFELPPWKQ